MNSGFAAPGVEDLPERIRCAYEALPAPDADRLAYIEAQLKRHLQSPRRGITMPWWAWLLLGAGAATAAWWAGEATHLPGVDSQVGEPAKPPAYIEHEAERATDETEPLEAAPADERRSPVIYQREGF